MRLHQLKPIHKGKSRKRIGRGGKRGTYSGRGVKGQKARAGNKVRAGFTGGDTSLIKRLPKKRGSVGAVKIKKGAKLGRRVKVVVLNLKDIEKKFAKDRGLKVISPKELIKKGLVSRMKGRIPPIKILGQGELKKKFHFKNIKLSKNAQQKSKIEKVKIKVKSRKQ